MGPGKSDRWRASTASACSRPRRTDRHSVAEAKAAKLVQQDQHEELNQKGSAGDKRVYTDQRAETRTVTPVWRPDRYSAARGGWRVHFF